MQKTYNDDEVNDKSVRNLLNPHLDVGNLESALPSHIDKNSEEDYVLFKRPTEIFDDELNFYQEKKKHEKDDDI